MAESTGKRRASVGVLFWIAFILLVLVIFLANRSNIQQVLETTGLVDVIRDRVADDAGDDPPDAVVTDQPARDPVAEQPPAGRPAQPQADDAVRTDPVVFDTEPAQQPVSDRDAPGVRVTDGPVNDAPVARPVTPPAADAVTDAPAREQRDVTKPNQRMAALYFIKVTEDGRTYPQRVVRAVAYDESPLTETIRALINGPTGSELTEGLLTLIPSGTELISAHVENGVAFLNFNRSFRFNPMGAEGTVAQLQQIIYSSTEFPTVLRVQFLIEGEQLDYVGGDGIYIGEPLGRDAFSS